MHRHRRQRPVAWPTGHGAVQARHRHPYLADPARGVAQADDPTCRGVHVDNDTDVQVGVLGGVGRKQ